MPKLPVRYCLCCDKKFRPSRPGQRYISRRHAVRYAVALHWARTHKDYHGSRRIKIARILKCKECGDVFELVPTGGPIGRIPKFCEKHRIPSEKYRRAS